eukprot:CAMPEP_0170597736 /NCGR_PEP_ID=MMETSP0224-20130122/15864_1 /TAXON_ID=285029 /ORGANISM="Togula jolla, Strain CCCM 725" /LENGTH=283 /DNA_ID=CAMNT_0010922223 /DNA_START=30 /DNA_END=881 /DNA_ORIENTATION=-
MAFGPDDISSRSSAEAWLDAMTAMSRATSNGTPTLTPKGATARQDMLKGTLSGSMGRRHSMDDQLYQGRRPSRDSQPSPGNTLIIFDWDDTLLCSSALQADWASGVSSAGLAELEELVLSLLKLSEDLGTIAIVTNSGQGWVESSAALFLPELLPTLGRIPVIYAREEYSKAFPRSSAQWKLQTFLELQRLNASTITNVLVIGDSNDEMMAARMLQKKWPQVLVKQVKFVARSSISELMQQLRLLKGELRRLVESSKGQKLEMLLEPSSDDETISLMGHDSTI